MPESQWAKLACSQLIIAKLAADDDVSFFIGTWSGIVIVNLGLTLLITRCFTQSELHTLNTSH